MVVGGHRGAFARLQLHVRPRRPPSARPFCQGTASQVHAPEPEPELPPVRILGPVVWSAAAVGTICFACAAYEVRRGLGTLDPGYRPRATDQDLELARERAASQEAQKADEWCSPERVTDPRASWEATPESARVMAALAGVSLATLIPATLSPAVRAALRARFAHVPAAPAFQYHTLLTSAFLHTGPWHLAANMMVVYNFSFGLTRTTALQYSGSGCLAFCLSAAIASSLGSHISTAFWPRKYARLSFSLGFSGVASALVAATCAIDPHLQISIIFLPIQFEAQNFLQGLKVFEALGALGLVGRVIPFMRNVDYAAHLSGLLFGEAFGKWSPHGEV